MSTKTRFGFMNQSFHTYRLKTMKLTEPVSILYIRDVIYPHKFVQHKFDTIPYFDKSDPLTPFRSILGFRESTFVDIRLDEVKHMTPCIERMPLSSWTQYCNTINMPLTVILGGDCDIENRRTLWDIALYLPLPKKTWTTKLT